jgi:hypothetical protein
MFSPWSTGSIAARKLKKIKIVRRYEKSAFANSLAGSSYCVQVQAENPNAPTRSFSANRFARHLSSKTHVKSNPLPSTRGRSQAMSGRRTAIRLLFWTRRLAGKLPLLR